MYAANYYRARAGGTYRSTFVSLRTKPTDSYSRKADSRDGLDVRSSEHSRGRKLCEQHREVIRVLVGERREDLDTKPHLIHVCNLPMQQPGHRSAIARRGIAHRRTRRDGLGIAAGAIERFAFSSPLIDLVTTGRISRREWMAQIAEHLGNHEAAAEWEHQLPP